jgi:YbgC/YbaW family acyl-CoA thioester hydrolase
LKKAIKRSVSVDVLFHDIDMLGIAHNATYFKWFERGWMAIMEDILPMRDALRDGISSVVIHNQCDYRKPCRFKDKLILTSRLLLPESRDRKLIFKHDLTNKLTRETIATGETQLTLIDLHTYKPLNKIPDRISQKLHLFREKQDNGTDSQ